MIYFLIEERKGGLIKIGYTDGHLYERISDMQTGNPALLLLLGAIPGATRRDESKLHKRFDRVRVRIRGNRGRRRCLRGERFKPTKELLKYIEILPPFPPPFVPKPAEPFTFGQSNDV